MDTPSILVAGASGNLGSRIVRALVDRGAQVRALVRPTTATEKTQRLEELGAEMVTMELSSIEELSAACSGVSCVVSALSPACGR